MAEKRVHYRDLVIGKCYEKCQKANGNDGKPKYLGIYDRVIEYGRPYDPDVDIAFYDEYNDSEVVFELDYTKPFFIEIESLAEKKRKRMELLAFDITTNTYAFAPENVVATQGLEPSFFFVTK